MTISTSEPTVPHAEVVVIYVGDNTNSIYLFENTISHNERVIDQIYDRFGETGAIYINGLTPTASTNQLNITTGSVRLRLNKKTYTNNLVSNSSGFFYINSTNHFVQCTDNTCLDKYADDSDIGNNKYYTIVWGVVPIDNNQQRLMVLLQGNPGTGREYKTALSAEEDVLSQASFFPNNIDFKEAFIPVVRTIHKRTGNNDFVALPTTGNLFQDLRGKATVASGGVPSPPITEHNILDNLEFNNSGHTFSNIGVTLDIGSYNLTTTGNITADYFIGDGSLLTGISGGIWTNVSGTATYPEDVNITGNLTLGENIIFAFGETIDNIVNGWIRITGSLNVTGTLNANNITLESNCNDGQVLKWINGVGICGTDETGNLTSDAYYRYYTTGWVGTNDWTNVHLGDTNTSTSNVSHNLNAPLSNLTVKILFSTDGTDANSWENDDVQRTHPTLTWINGVVTIAVDNNNIIVQTGLNGIYTIQDDGAVNTLTTQAYFYKIVVTQIIRLNTTPLFGGTPAGAIMSFNLASCPIGWISADGSSGTPDLTPYEYDTGWLGINGDDWTNVHLGSDNDTKTSNVTHNLGAPLSDLDVKVLVSTDGTDANSFEFVSQTEDGQENQGVIILAVDNDNLIVQTGANGIHAMNDAGGWYLIDSEDYFYKVKVKKKFSGNSSLIYCQKTTEDTETSNTIWGESGDNIFVQNTSKNVGIGTSNPTHKLNVVGDVNVTGNLTLGQTITFAFNEVIDNIIDGWITITGGLNVVGDVNVTGNLNVTGDLNLGGNVNVTGNITLERNIYVETNQRIYFGDGQESSIYFNGSDLIFD